MHKNLNRTVSTFILFILFIRKRVCWCWCKNSTCLVAIKLLKTTILTVFIHFILYTYEICSEQHRPRLCRLCVLSVSFYLFRFGVSIHVKPSNYLTIDNYKCTKYIEKLEKRKTHNNNSSTQNIGVFHFILNSICV